ncbi:MAG: M24 family metallopeptidase [Rubripirellula sp.]
MTAELSLRLRTLTNLLADLEIDAMLVTDEKNVRYLSGFTGDSSYLLVQPAGTTILSDGRYDTQIAKECGELAAVIRPPGQLLGDLTQSVLNESGAARIGIEASQLTLSAYRYLDSACPGIELIETSGVVEGLRMIKDDVEIEITRQAVRIAERAFAALLPMLNEGWSERAIAHELEAKMRFLGAEGCSFAPIVAAGAAGALPHYHPHDVVLGGASTLLIDWGANFQGYASDLTRTLHRDSASNAFRSAYDAVLEAQLAAIDKIGPGVPAKEVDAVARGVLEQAGIGDAFKHGLGHGTGLQIHEAPRMSSISEETLASGMIITVEPGVYFEGDFGIRIEDDVLVTETGCEVLSQLPKGLDDCRLML